MKAFLSSILAAFLLVSCSSENSIGINIEDIKTRSEIPDVLYQQSRIVFDLVMIHKNNLKPILEDEKSTLNKEMLILHNSIRKLKQTNNIEDIAQLLAINLSEYYINGTSAGDEVSLGTPCTDAFNLSVMTATVAFGATIMGTGGVGVVGAGAYAGALTAATVNWCACMSNNYGAGC